MAAIRKAPGESFEDLVTAEIPLAVLIGKGHTSADLQRASRDWENHCGSRHQDIGEKACSLHQVVPLSMRDFKGSCRRHSCCAYVRPCGTLVECSTGYSTVWWVRASNDPCMQIDQQASIA